MIVLIIHARGATAAPLPGSWCVHNTARRAAAYHGGSEALPGVEDPGSGSESDEGQHARALCLDLALGRLGS